MSVSNSNMMTRRHLALVVIFTGLMLFSTFSSLPAASAAATPSNFRVEAVQPIQKFALTEWTVPTAASRPYGIGVDPNGRVWFTENSTNKLGRFDPSNNNFTEWTISTPNSQPRRVFVTINGTIIQVFFTEFASNKIARFDTVSNNLTEWNLPAGSNPAGIYVDETGSVWVAESGRDAIARLNPSTNNLTEWILPGATSTPGSPALQPWGIYVQTVTRPSYTNRFVWFTEMLGNKIGRIEVTSNRLTIWDLSTLGLGTYSPGDLTIGIFQTLPVAIITNGNNKISILGNDTGGGSLYQETTLLSLNAGAMGLTYDAPRNAAWFAENNVADIANLNTTNVLAGQLFTPTYCTISPRIGIPTCSSSNTVSSIIAHTRNNLPAVSRLASPVTSQNVGIHQGPINGLTEYSLPNATSRPTSVSVDSIGNVWFAENNATVNRIGRLSIPYVFNLSVSPGTQAIHPGQTATYSINVTLTSGAPQSVQLSLLNTPSGVTAVFNPQSQNPPFVSTLTFTTTNSTPTGTFPMTVQAVSGGQTQTASISLSIGAIPPPVFDFNINVAAPTTETVLQGGTASFNITVGLVSGTPQTVNLTATGLPAGVSYSFTNPSATPSFTSTINIFTSTITPGGSYHLSITGTTSTGLTHTAPQIPLLTITELPRDFNLTTQATSLVLVQASQTNFVLTAAATGYFNGNITLNGNFSPSSGLIATFTPSMLTLQTGSIAQSTVEITAPKDTVGTYQFTITGTSTTPSRTHALTVTVKVSPCLIATATYGSELAPQVQFLRNFRDQQIMNTFAGTNFMTAFNAWYYSFSPTVAQYESQNPTARSIAKTALYPLLGILELAHLTFSAFGPASEFGALAAGLLAGALIGLTYLAAPFLLILWPVRRRINTKAKGRVIKVTTIMFAILLAGFATAEILALPTVMMVSSAGLVLAALSATALLPALIAIQFKRKAD